MLLVAESSSYYNVVFCLSYVFYCGVFAFVIAATKREVLRVRDFALIYKVAAPPETDKECTSDCCAQAQQLISGIGKHVQRASGHRCFWCDRKLIWQSRDHCRTVSGLGGRRLVGCGHDGLQGQGPTAFHA